MEKSNIKIGVISFSAAILMMAVMSLMGVVTIGLGSVNNFEEQNIDFIQVQSNRYLVSTLKETLPVYYETLVNSTELDTAQKTSLKLLYLPVINEFIETGEIRLIDKGNSLKHLIINDTLRAELKSES